MAEATVSQADLPTITRAAEILRAGGLVAFPTETVYGLGADALNAASVARIFAVKDRPPTNPLILHLGSLEQIATITTADAPLKLLEKLSAFWPGPLTVVLPRNAAVPAIACGGQETVAVRIPAHPVALKLIELLGRPIAAPSANPSGYVSPTCADHVAVQLGDKIDLILDGGPTKIGIESTILSLVHPAPTILRHGAITLEQLREILTEVIDGCADSGQARASALQIEVPGMRGSHYAPRTPVQVRSRADRNRYPQRTGFISFGALAEDQSEEVFNSRINLNPEGRIEDIAHGLYAALREMDRHKLDLIVIDRCRPAGLGRAIMERVWRAAGGKPE